MSSSMSPTPGTASHADWSQSLQPLVLGLSITMLVLGNLGVVLRCWAQWRFQKRPMPEDYWLMMALLFANIVSIATIVAVHYGLGLHLFRVEAEDPSLHSLKWIFLCVWLTASFNGPSMLGTKVALLLYYRRLFIVQQLGMRIFWWANLAYVILWAIGSTLSYILSCVPASYYWERFNPDSTMKGTCHNSTTADAVPLILDLVSDIAIMILPIATIATLQMPLARKAGLMIVFSLNVAIVCATAVPIVSRVRLAFRESRKKHSRSISDAYVYARSPTGGRPSTMMRRPEPSSSTEQLRTGQLSTSCASEEQGGMPLVPMNGILVRMDVDVQ
ncbi:hypothetical protein EYZ11_008382 [Aspergillus tanneri]|uniref:Rhodopsin domain-containing protein n=1 Tax=Aspergillus tanneri TaxID=1220188 RepID=A0A4S3JCQ6_9EURO|nr:hypothetical protein EYZ11_008382 [Aspergillus tanneri]